MRKIKILNILNGIWLVLFMLAGLILFFVSKLIFDKLWVLLLISFIAVRLLLKYLLFQNDSILWLFIVSVAMIIFVLLVNFYGVNILNLYILVLSPAVASMVLFLIHKNNVHFLLWICSLVFLFPIPLLVDGVIDWILFLIIEFGVLILLLIILFVIKIIRKRCV